MKISKLTALSIALLIICPILALPIILYNIYKTNSKSAYALFAVFLGLVAFLTPPYSDLYRHTMRYYQEPDSFNLFLQYLSIRRDTDFLTQFVSYTLSNCNIDFAFARLFYIVVEISIVSYIFRQIYPINETRSVRFVLFVICFFSYNFFVSTIGVRHGLALSFYLLALYLLYVKENSTSSILCYGLASITHFAFFPLALIAFCVHFIPYKISNKTFIILSVICLCTGLIVSTFLISTFFKEESGAYLNGEWGVNYKTTFNGMVFYYLRRFWILPFFLYFIKYNQNTDYRLKNIIYALVLLFLMTSSLATLSGRILDIVTSILILYYVGSYKNHRFLRVKTALIISSIFFSANIYTFRDVAFISDNNHYSELYKPLPILLNSTFSKYWIHNHVNAKGELYNSIRK